MAIYIYRIDTGELFSQLLGDLTIADQQAFNLQNPMAGLAQPDVLAAEGLMAVDGLPDLGPAVAWDPTTRTTIAVTPPLEPLPIQTGVWILRFTPVEFQAIMASTDAVVQQFLYALNHTTVIDLSTPTITNGVGYLVSINLLQSDRVAAVLAGA